MKIRQLVVRRKRIRSPDTRHSAFTKGVECPQNTNHNTFTQVNLKYVPAITERSDGF